jgi:hypothetical protein
MHPDNLFCVLSSDEPFQVTNATALAVVEICAPGRPSAGHQTGGRPQQTLLAAGAVLAAFAAAGGVGRRRAGCPGPPADLA